MDCVYVLGTGSGWQDNELRFSLRAIETYLSDIGNVFVVGPQPKFLTNVIHIPFNDRFACKERNIMIKLARACGHPELSSSFLHLHDDHFCLFPQSACTIPNWASSSLERTAQAAKPQNHWRQAVLNTHKALLSKGLPTKNFDLHYPMRINKEIYPEIMDRYNWAEPRGFVVKSLYGNTAGITPTMSPDLKIDYRCSIADLVARLRARKWFSVGPSGLTGEFKKLLEALFPQPSKYEILGR